MNALFYTVLNTPKPVIVDGQEYLVSGWDRPKNDALAAQRGRHAFIPTGVAGIDRIAALVYVRHAQVTSPYTVPNAIGTDANIFLPYPEAFLSHAYYCRTVAHELAHLSGFRWHLRYMPTKIDMGLNPSVQAIEEMTADLSGYIYCRELGCTDEATQKAQLAYVRHYMAFISKDPSTEDVQRAFDKAYSQAQDVVAKFRELAR